MTDAFDPRIVQVGIDLGNGLKTYEGLAIYASGVKYASAMFNECEARIYNLTRDERNNILTQASPLIRTQAKPVFLSLDVGRESYGTFRLFEGNVISCNVTQPPDIGISLRSLTSSFESGVILRDNQSSIALLSIISQNIAKTLGLTLQFQATDKQIDNYSFTGAAVKQVDKLNQVGGVVAFIDNRTLVVLDSNKPKAGTRRLISAQTGMVGIPQVTEQGVLVKVMMDNSLQLGGPVQIQSLMNPAANGDYRIVKMSYEVANRDQPFWYSLECQLENYYLGTL